MIHNFSAGPSKVYKEVLEKAQKNLVTYKGYGFSLLEMSHRDKTYQDLQQHATELLCTLLSLDEQHHVLFLGGGATLQFSMLVSNLLPYADDVLSKESDADSNEGSNNTSKFFAQRAGYIVTGAWGQKAYKDAKIISPHVDLVYSGEEHAFTCFSQRLDQLVSRINEQKHTYIHITTNETIHGIQWKTEALETVYKITPLLVADMSSDILSRDVFVNNYDLFYAGAQKNLGVAGVTLVVMGNSVLEQSAKKNLPSYLSYAKHHEAHSLYNTPPMFAIWMLSLVLEHIVDIGGLATVQERNTQKANMLYHYIDSSDAFYHCPVQKSYRSDMNVVFTLADKDKEHSFLAYAQERNIYGLKGHRSIGGCRASLYNAVTLEDVEALITCMKTFKNKC